MSDEAHNPDLTALEAGLASLAPAAPAIDRDYLFYHAGRTAARQGRGVWPYTTGLMAALALGLGWVAIHRPQPLPLVENPEPRIVYVPSPKSNELPPKPENDGPSTRPATLPQVKERTFEDRMKDLRIRDQVLLMGVDALPRQPESTIPEKRARLDPLLGMPATVLDEPGRNILKGLN
jgi:hypothetical protein